MSHQDNQHATEWLAAGVENLFLEVEQGMAREVDVLIVGSGYGGAVAAATLAGCAREDGQKARVVVLERGREHLPGSFPEGASALPGHIRWSGPGMSGPQGRREGLFDLRIGPDINALVANGLGGGSLINAGVMLEPDAGTIERLQLGADLAGYMAETRAMLDTPVSNTIESHPAHADDKGPLKYHALRHLAGKMGPKAQFKAVPISVAMASGPNSAGVAMDACIQCGDCATGCNHNAKLSLDSNLLVKARVQGAEIYTGATVLKLEPAGGGWLLHVVYTDDKLRRRHTSPFKIRARKVILAAGTFGSTEILLRSRSGKLDMPLRLGQGFSGNGDMIAVAYDYPDQANAVADEREAAGARAIGPTITASIDTESAEGTRLCFEEIAVPAAMRRVFEEVATTVAVLHRMGEIDHTEHVPDGPDPCAVSAHALSHSSILAVMGDDGARGELELVGDDDAACGDGAIRVRWPGLREDSLFQQQIDTIPPACNSTGLVLPNPSWRFLSSKMEKMITAKRGPLTTAHPLGGCAMGEGEGFCVNLSGQLAFSADEAEPGSLAVLDGSVLPGALGINPALTIAALSLRASRSLRQAWKLSADAAQTVAPCDAALAPSPRRAMPSPPPTPVPTEIEIVERLAGKAMLRRRSGRYDAFMLVLTMRYKARGLSGMSLPEGGQEVPMRRSQDLLSTHSFLEVFDLDKWETWTLRREGQPGTRPEPLIKTSLFGRLDFLHREPSSARQRMIRGGLAWLRNRGLRDTWQSVRKSYQMQSLLTPADGETRCEFFHRWWHGLKALASRAGEVRLFEYKLKVGTVDTGHTTDDDIILPRLARIRGVKRLTYACLSNPLSQLGTLTVTEFPGLGCPAFLKLDTDFLVQENAPLLRVLRQQDQPAALLDLAGLGGALARVLLNVHLSTFRKPDTPPQRTAQRLPGKLRGLPDPQVHEVLVDRMPDGAPVHVRMTRYQRGDTTMVPVVLIHGYSTGGNSFAHAKVDPSLASHLWRSGRDVWVLDLRTSSGMPFARIPWTFEQVALADIPAAVDYICRAAKSDQLDMMSHCMGGAMTGMAVLAQLKAGERFYRERELLPGRIRRLVLSQVGPLVVFTQANILRAYMMNYVKSVLPKVHYTFRVEGEPTLGDELLDRLLSAMPYPLEERAIENHWWPFTDTSYVGTRHRMDALYGRDFNLLNVERNVLDNLDDFFGPLSLATVSQSIHFALRKSVTDRSGRNVFVSRASLSRWVFPTLYIHGEDNGLSGVATLQRMASVLDDAGHPIATHVFEGFGHQDSWLGRDAIKVFRVVADFLEGKGPDLQARKPQTKKVAQIPFGGPVWIGPAASSGQGDLFAIMCDPGMPSAAFVALVPIDIAGTTRPTRHYALAGGMQPTIRDWKPDPDGEGWMKVEREPAMIGPKGTMVFIIYEDSAVMANRPHNADRKVKPEVEEAATTVDGAIALELARNNMAGLNGGILGVAPGQRWPQSPVTFAAGSCQYPPGILDSKPAYDAWRRLGLSLKGMWAPAFVVLAGDQIYSDASAGLFDPSALDDRYKRPYEKMFSNIHVRGVLRRRPAYMMLDDHEIGDDWSDEPDRAARDALKAGREGYCKYQRALDGVQDQLWYTFTRAGLDFFMGDTRSERQARSLNNIGSAEIMSDGQMTKLLAWLQQERQGPRFVVTPSMIGPRKRAQAGASEAGRLRCDGWDAYPASLHKLLGAICLLNIRDVVFISGDEHISFDSILTLSGAGNTVTVRSIHASALYAPYPFANARVDDFMPDSDCWRFSAARGCTTFDIDVQAETSFYDGTGFAIVTVETDGAVSVNFERQKTSGRSRRRTRAKGRKSGTGATRQPALPASDMVDDEPAVSP